MKPKNRIFNLPAAFVIATLAATGASHAAKTWSGATSVTWATATNWVEGSAPGTTETAVFNSSSTTNLAITLGASATIRGIDFSTPANDISIGSNTLTIASNGINMATANRNLTISSAVTVQSAIHSWNVASGTTLTTPVPVRNPGANNDNVGGHIVVSGAGTVKMGAAALGLIVDGGGGNPFVSIAATEDWAATNASGTVIPATYTNDAFTGNANIVTAGTYTTNGANPNGIRFANTTGAVTVTNSNTSTYRGILMTSGADSVTINGGNIRPNRLGTAGASFSIIQNSTSKDLTIGSTLSVASSNTPVSVIKGGPGRVIFTGSYSAGAGRIFIHQGTAQYGNGGTTGDPGNTASSIINNASLVFNRSNTLTVITNISGTGSLTQSGSGELAFTTSVSTFTGPVNINAGTLSATTLNNLGAGTAININGGALKFSGAFDPSARTITIGSGGASFNTNTQNITFANAVGNSGSGNFTKAGTGSLTLTQPAGWTGSTNIDGGTLLVTNTTGSATSGAVTIGAAGGLGGTGTVAGAVTTTSGSIITPGTSGVSTLNVGSLTLESGSVTNLEFGTGNDQVNVTTADGLILNGGSINLYQDGTNFTTPFAGTPGTYNLFQYTGTLGGSIGNLSVGNPQPGKSYVFGTSGGFVTLTIANSGVNRNWITDGSGGWDNAANWNGTVPDASQSVANFITALTAPATVSLNGSKTTGNLVFTSATNGYTIDAGSGGSLILSNGGSNATINVNSGIHFISTPISLNNSVDIALPLAGRSLTLSGIISGTGLSLTKTGLGDLNLTAANTFTGDIALTGGSTTFAPSGLGTGNLFLDGVKLVWDGTNTEDLTSGARTVSMIDNVITFDTNGNDVQFANSIGENGNASLVKIGGGKLTLAADNTFFGSLTINNGELALGNGGASGSVPGAIVNNTQMTINRSDTATIASAISGTGSLEKVGTNEIILSGNNSFTGDTFLTAGILTIGNTNALQRSKLDYTTGTLQFGAVTAATIGGLTGSIDLPLTNASAAAVALTIGGANGSGEYSGKFSGAGSLTKAGTGILILSNDNTYTGATGINNAGGTIDLTTGGKISTTALNTGIATRFMVTGGDLTCSAQTTISSEGYNANSGFNLITGTATFNGGIRTGGNDGSLISVAGGTFTASSVTLQRTQNFQGFAAGPSSSATSYVETGASNATGFVVSGGTVTISGPLNVGTTNSCASALISGGTTTVAGVVTVGNTGNTRWNLLEVSGGSFSANNAVSGIVLSPHPTTATLSMLKVTGSGVATAKRISLGTATSAAGTGAVWVKGGTLYVGAGGIVQDAAIFTSRLTLTTGTLGADDTWSTTLPAALEGAFTLKAANEANAAKDITLGGALTGAGSLTKTGGGVVTLNGVNNYTGATTINEGTLSLSNDDVLSDTALVNVATGATLNLNHAGTDTVLNFQINGVDQGSGTFGGTGSGADHIVPQITGTGKLYVIPTDPFLPWIAGFGLTGSDALPGSDPDNDGQNNLLEFALNGIPNSGASSGKLRSSVELVAGDNALTYTLPVRTGAVFSGSAAQTSTIDGITYTIEGSDALSTWNTTVISEVVPALSGGLPALDTGWTYRTFRTPGSTSSDPGDFIRSKVSN